MSEELAPMRKVTEELVQELKSRNLKIVLAESCSCGLAAAAMGQVPGVSENFCGSFVTYRNSAKMEWLGLDMDRLAKFTATSKETSESMARESLAKSSEADVAAAITGHLGPDSTDGLDGMVFVAIAVRRSDGKLTVCHCGGERLVATTRSDRQRESVLILFRIARDVVSQLESGT